jgi:predicted nucleic acid-binding protein
VIVADATVLVVALADDGSHGDQARSRLHGERLTGPELADLEVASVLRRQMKQALSTPGAPASHSTTWPHCPPGGHRTAPCSPAAELRNTLTVYDAAYVALAEAMNTALLTGDRTLARAAGPQCPIEIFQPAP